MDPTPLNAPGSDWFKREFATVLRKNCFPPALFALPALPVLPITPAPIAPRPGSLPVRILLVLLLTAWIANAAGAQDGMAGDAPGAPAEELWAPPTNLRTADNPNDNGHGIILTWEPSPDADRLLMYDIYRLPYRPDSLGGPLEPGAPEADWILAGSVPAADTSFLDQQDKVGSGRSYNPLFVPRGQPVYYRLRARAADGSVSPLTPPVSGIARGDWIHTQRGNVLFIALLLGILMVYFIRHARQGGKLYIRPIPGLSRIDEAIGRATEMGRPILFVLGTGTAGDIATLAGYTILARVARKTAEYQTPLLVPVNDPVMMVMAQQTVKEAYLQAGRPEIYEPDNVFYISAMQFPYVAAVNGLMLREKTATNFYMGVFHAEALLLAEAGATTGSIQMSGTDQVAQIPFFVAATDYTLIGEELYAASAYLSQDPKLIGPLKAQDVVKALILIVATLGVLEATIFKTNLITNIITPH